MIFRVIVQAHPDLYIFCNLFGGPKSRKIYPYSVLMHCNESCLAALSLWFIAHLHVLPATLHFVAAYVALGLLMPPGRQMSATS